MLVYLNIAELPGAIIAGRLGSIFKYPNTFGMAMIMFYFFALLMLIRRETTRIQVIMYSLPLVSYLVCFILAYSRGMILVFPIVWLIGLFLLKAKKQIDYCLYSLISIAFSLLTYIVLVRSFSSVLKLIVLIVVCIAFFGCVLFIRLLLEKWESHTKWMEEKGIFRMLIPSIVLMIFILGILDITHQGIAFQQLPIRLQERIESIDITSGTAKERLIFNEDALKISKESPLIGLGGEAFRVIFKKYQELPYRSNKIHNGFFEWLVDTGWIGFSILIGVIIYFYLRILKLYFKEENETQLAVFLSTLVIFIHSFIDFNFSYGTVWFFVFWLFILGINRNSDTNLSHQKKKKSQKTDIKPEKDYFSISVYSIFSAVVVICFIFSYRFMEADKIVKNVKSSMNPAILEQEMERAVTLDPTNIEYWMKLSDIYVKGHQQNSATKEKVEKVIKKMINLEPNNSEVFRNAGILSEKIGNLEAAVYYYDEGLKLDRYNTGLYTSSIRSKNHLVNQMIHEKNSNTEVEPLLQSAIDDYKDNIYWYEYFLSQPIKDLDAFNGRDFKVSYLTHYNAALAYFHLEQYEQVLNISEQVVNEKNHDLMALAILSLESMGENEKANEMITENQKKYDNFTESLEALRKTYQPKF
ncbi:O-antigen ligase family protein [Bacillus timonensis]|uniref:O-antigen ligase family protein n=1 Tax=Bacillus timonensis TaxID=1033734 RepID=UPI001386FDB1|nr:O-antigen ligase family protein [Bacillus timonensis]